MGDEEQEQAEKSAAPSDAWLRYPREKLLSLKDSPLSIAPADLVAPEGYSG
jgi:hypothetical protein